MSALLTWYKFYFLFGVKGRDESARIPRTGVCNGDSRTLIWIRAEL
jgi:hypothetical protein